MLKILLAAVVFMPACVMGMDDDTTRGTAAPQVLDGLYQEVLAADDAAMEPYLEHLAWLTEHPLDLNTADASDLAGLPGMSPGDAQSVLLWRRRAGRFTAVEDLLRRGTDGMRLYRLLAPFVTTSVSSIAYARLRSRFTSRLSGRTSGSAGEGALSGVREYHRLSLRPVPGVTGAMTMVREPGQRYADAFVTGNVAYVSPDGLIERVVAGDLSAGCAQGLVFGRTQAGMSGGTEAWGWSGPLKLEPFHGTSGTQAVRGAGIVMRIRSVAGIFSLAAFAGRTPFAASLDEDGKITSFDLRSDPDRRSDDPQPVVHEWSAGARLAWIPPTGPSAGISLLWSRMSRPFAGDAPFSKMQSMRAAGADLSVVSGRMTMSVEGAWMDEGHAVIGRMGFALDAQVSLSAGAWYVSPGYRDRKSGSGLRGAGLTNDAGVACRFECVPASGMTVTGAVAHFRRPWRTTFDHLPPEGNELSARISQRVSRALTVAIAVRSSATESWERTDASTQLPLSGMERTMRRSLLASVECSISRTVGLQTRIGHVHASGTGMGGDEDGWMMCNDLHLACAPGVTIDARWETVTTDSYASRVYVIEREVEGGYSAPPMYGNGIRWYVLLRTAIADGVTLALRYAATHRVSGLRLQADAPVLTLQCDADPASFLPFL